MFNLAEEFPPVQTGHALKMTCIAAAMVVLAIAAYLYWGRVSPATAGDMLELTPYQAEAKTPDSLHPDPNHSPLLVLADVRVQNKSRKPLSIFELSATLAIGKDRYHSLDVSADDFEKVFEFYPELAQHRQAPLLRHAVIQPGESLKGMMVFDYPVTMEQWNLRSSFQVNIAFDHERDLVVTDAGEPLAPADE